jgi:hypothetical protein
VTFPQGTKPRLIQVALAEVGTAETGNNETKYGKFMKADKLPWCGSFLQLVRIKPASKVPNVVSTRAGAEAFKKKPSNGTQRQRLVILFSLILLMMTKPSSITLVW